MKREYKAFLLVILGFFLYLPKLFAVDFSEESLYFSEGNEANILINSQQNRLYRTQDEVNRAEQPQINNIAIYEKFIYCAGIASSIYLLLDVVHSKTTEDIKRAELEQAMANYMNLASVLTSLAIQLDAKDNSSQLARRYVKDITEALTSNIVDAVKGFEALISEYQNVCVY